MRLDERLSQLHPASGGDRHRIIRSEADFNRVEADFNRVEVRKDVRT